MLNPISLCSVSWIDQKGLPTVGFGFAASAGVPESIGNSWPKKVVIGLVATSNPEPPPTLHNVDGFRSRKQYRALLSLSLNRRPPIKASRVVIDPGFTPPIDKSKIDTLLRHLMPLPDDPKFYPGEASARSSVEIGRLHGNSMLNVPRDCDVLVSAFLKFRAGAHTNEIGVEKADSPFHVPWVWCEYALLSSAAGYRLLARGSRFPSHAWYVNGTHVKKVYQAPVTASDTEPAISTGRPANQPRADSGSDKSTGPASKNEYTVPAGEAVDIDVTRFVDRSTAQ